MSCPGFLANRFEKHAPGLRHRRSRHHLALAVHAGCCLPRLERRRHRELRFRC